MRPIAEYQDELTQQLNRKSLLRATLIYVTRDLENPVPPAGHAQFFPTRWERFLKILENILRHPTELVSRSS